jgi:hypothetical protein
VKKIPLEQLSFFAQLAFQIMQFLKPTEEGRERRAARQARHDLRKTLKEWTKRRDAYSKKVWDHISANDDPLHYYSTEMDAWHERNDKPELADFVVEEAWSSTLNHPARSSPS